MTGELVRVVDHDVKPGAEMHEKNDQGRPWASGKAALAGPPC